MDAPVQTGASARSWYLFVFKSRTDRGRARAAGKNAETAWRPRADGPAKPRDSRPTSQNGPGLTALPPTLAVPLVRSAGAGVCCNGIRIRPRPRRCKRQHPRRHLRGHVPGLLDLAIRSGRASARASLQRRATGIFDRRAIRNIGPNRFAAEGGSRRSAGALARSQVARRGPRLRACPGGRTSFGRLRPSRCARCGLLAHAQARADLRGTAAPRHDSPGPGQRPVLAAQPGVLIQRYDDLIAAPATRVSELARHLGLAIDDSQALSIVELYSAESNRARAEALRRRLTDAGVDLGSAANAQICDPKTLLHWNHMRAARPPHGARRQRRASGRFSTGCAGTGLLSMVIRPTSPARTSEAGAGRGPGTLYAIRPTCWRASAHTWLGRHHNVRPACRG